MDAQGTQATCLGTHSARYHIGGEHMCTMRIWITEEVGKCNGGEGVVVRVGGFVEFDHDCGFIED